MWRRGSAVAAMRPVAEAFDAFDACDAFDAFEARSVHSVRAGGFLLYSRGSVCGVRQP
jgi:hypothetical protein